MRATEDNRFIRKMISRSISALSKVQQDHMKETDPVRCASCQKGLEKSSVYPKDRRAPEDGQGGRGLNLTPGLGSTFSSCVATGKLLNLSGLSFPCLRNGVSNSI